MTRRTLSSLILVTLLATACTAAVAVAQTTGTKLQLSDSTLVPPVATEVDQTLDQFANEATSWIVRLLPEAMRKGSFLRLHYWQWLALFGFILLGFIVDTFVRNVTRPVMRRVGRRFPDDVDKDMVDRFVRGIGLLAGALTWLVLVRVLDLEGNLRHVGRAATGFYLVLIGTMTSLRVIDFTAAISANLARRTEAKFDDILVPLLRKTAKVFVFALGVVYGAITLHIDIVPLITGLGIGGLAFAFAAKDTIENFFGSIAVIMDRPFEVGDRIVVDEVEGVVEELGFRSTRIRTFYNSQVTIPNATLVRAKVDNYGRRTYRRWKTMLGVQYDTRPEQLLAFTEGIRELIRQHPYTRKDFYQVRCYDYGDFSLNIILYMFFQAPDWSTELRERENLFVDIVRLADQLGVNFAFPTSTIHMFKEEHKPHEIRHAIPKGMEDESARILGAEAASRLVADQHWRDNPPGRYEFKVGDETTTSRDAGGSDAGE